ncbi:MAG: PRTRC system ThiF family protein [Steroidobacteraceae bacterium]
MQQTFHTPNNWLDHRIRVLLLGAGGTGGEVLYALARLHTMLLEFGHVSGLHVTLMDGDTVSRANIGRQRFYRCDIGYPKASVLIQRHNLAFMLDWRAVDQNWTAKRGDGLWLGRYDLVISCVDRAAVRVELARAGRSLQVPLLWMDFGNGQHTGQCILGHLGGAAGSPALRLPNVYDLYPELVDVDDDAAPSCSSMEAIRHQDLFTNPLLAEAGISLLWKLMHTGSTTTHGVFIDAREPCVSGLPIDPDVWALYRADPTRRQRKKIGRRRRRRPTRRARAGSAAASR